MKLFNIIAAGSLMGLVATSAFAASDAVINTIAQDLAAQGYTKIHIVNSGSSVKVEATGPNGSLEQVYDGSGNVVRTGSSNDGASRNVVSGVVGVSNTTSGNDIVSGDNDGDNDGFGGNDNDDDGNGDDDRGGSHRSDHGNDRGHDNHSGGRDNDRGHGNDDRGGRDNDRGHDNDDHGGRDNDD